MTLSKMSLAVALSGVMVLTACDSVVDPNNPNSNTQTGALVGAGVGAIIGAARSDGDSGARNRSAIVGAVLGAGLGAGAGVLLDQQEAELRQQLGSNATITNTGEQLIVSLPQDILFATDSAALTGGLRSDITALSASINNYPDTTINVIGHADNTGGAAYNQDLSARRAQAVSSALISSGVNPGRIRSIGRGEDAPIASNLTPEGRALNRRVEITITPNG
ncbi:OmpA family protein [Octadecabacter sp. 1_MG-2023]|uniref:OmpA family protein n=1 Tax=unclassified Octadecabacter TaxID=196158 RepID=UPI001C0A30CB|nr:MULTISPECIES: OmpA family protein [unclassified Octadecabacter]MBU2994299.1 OmpA family protein [Octadecabacter sp. B2R22]MDO6734412.1 OmpA family protein [Octadecabacter sp. 1_MG-2023]